MDYDRAFGLVIHAMLRTMYWESDLVTTWAVIDKLVLQTPEEVEAVRTLLSIPREEMLILSRKFNANSWPSHVIQLWLDLCKQGFDQKTMADIAEVTIRFTPAFNTFINRLYMENYEEAQALLAARTTG